MTELRWHGRREPGPDIRRHDDGATLALLDAAPESAGIDLARMRRYRQARVRAQMAARGIDVLILSDPVNIRYATGTRNMQVFSQRNAPARYLVLSAGRSLLFEFAGCEHLARGFETIDEVRPARTASFVAAGSRIAQAEERWAAEMAALLRELAGAAPVVGVERLNARAMLGLDRHGVRLVDAQEPVEMARCIKSDDELACVRASLRATEAAVQALRDAIRPGQTENELWSVLHAAVIRRNGDYCETRLLSSGPRTNPWFRESGTRRLGPNELVALDTDVVGCHGYFSDFSRTFHSGPDRPGAAQRALYRAAYEQVMHNLALIAPGVTFREYAERAWPIPPRYFAHRYYLSAHGCGMSGEYPYLYHRADFGAAGYDGTILPGMVLCVESFVGEEGAGEGVKLEQQVCVTDTGCEVLSCFPFEDDLL